MTRAILKLRFPSGTLPVRGWVCPRCGDELVGARESADAEATAQRLGLFGLEDRTARKVTRVGDSAGVTLDPELMRHANIAIGDRVDVGRVGDAIVIRRRSADGKDPLGFARGLPKRTMSAKEQLRRIEADRDSTRVDA